MDSLFSWTSILSNFFDFEESNPLLLVNHLLQAFFFSSAICHLCALALKLIHFAYAQEVAASRLTHLLGLFLFYYLKVWNFYSGLVYFIGLFSLAVVSLYVYDCCGNISSHLDTWRAQNRDLAIILSFTLMFSTTLYLLWQIFKNQTNPLIYSNSGIYCIIITVLLVGNYLRKRSILYTLMGVLTINYLIAARHFLHDELQGNSLLRLSQIPLQTLVYFIMAIDAEKKERDYIKVDRYRSVFLSCTYLAAYSLLNHWEFPFELLFGGMNIICLIIGK